MATARNAISRPETLKEILETTRMELDYLKERCGVERLAIFGSFAKGHRRKRSDPDILVELRKPLGFDFLRLADQFGANLGQKS